MSLIVADTSPLNLLINIQQVAILPQLFGKVLIPDVVANELRHPIAPDSVREFMDNLPSWLNIQTPKSEFEHPQLDPGESAAIALAVELAAPVLIDERKGREVARSQGLEVVGAIGVLELAARQGLIQDFPAVVAQIRLEKFHVADEILDAVLTKYFDSVNKKP